VPKIFISYRRSDTEWAAGRLRDALVRHFGDSQIFRDKENVPPGVDWREGIRLALSEPTTIVLALIGPFWLTELDREGHRLIDSIESPNRLELEIALRGRLTTIPVLVGSRMPSVDELPESLRALTSINALKLRDDDWSGDVQRLFAALEARGVKPADSVLTHGVSSKTTTGTEEDRGHVRRWLASPVVWLSAVALVAIIAVVLYPVATRSNTSGVVQKPEVAVPEVVINDNAPNFEIVLDRSDAMKEAFGKVSKLDGAKSAVIKALELVSDSDNISYREFGGECGSSATNTQLLLSFAPGKDRLERQLNSLATTSGQSTIVSAVVEATGDFNEPRFKESRLNKLIVITGGFHECDSDPAARIKERLRIYPDVEVDLHFIGAGLTPVAQSALRTLAQGTGTRTTVHTVRDPAELEGALQDVLLVERRVEEVKEAIVILNQCIEHLERTADAIGKKDYATADAALSLAVSTLERTNIPKAESGQPEGVRQLLDLAGESRNDQQKMLDAVKVFIAVSKSNDTAGERKARAAYIAAAGAFNARLPKIEQLQNDLLAGKSGR